MAYLDLIKNTYINNGITGPFYTADNLQFYYTKGIHMEGTAIGLNGESVM